MRRKHFAFANFFIDLDSESFGARRERFQIAKHAIDNCLPSAH
jgi:hypothetical protein